VIRPGEPWGSPTAEPPAVEVAGGDAALAGVVAATHRAGPSAEPVLVRFRPDATSDLARAVGLAPEARRDGAEPQGLALPLDLLEVGEGTRACNMCVLGTPPDRLRWWSRSFEIDVRLDGRPFFCGRAATVVVATGQYLRGLDVVPRGHPGDGKAEVQVYGLERRERRLLRARLATGAHVPHPGIRQRSAGVVELRIDGPAHLEIDGVTGSPGLGSTTIRVLPSAYRLLV
jgi:YegS C-terminal NAD kinase beta sandwich-like domain